jgi:hypothetical protein
VCAVRRVADTNGAKGDSGEKEELKMGTVSGREGGGRDVMMKNEKKRGRRELQGTSTSILTSPNQTDFGHSHRFEPDRIPDRISSRGRPKLDF